MTRCECAEMAFSAIARLVREQGLSLEEITHRTGCGRTCTACLPDLQAYPEVALTGAPAQSGFRSKIREGCASGG